MPITTRALSSLSLLFSSSPSTKLAPSPLFLRRFPFSLRLPFSTTATPYPLYYELVRHRPPPRSRRSRPHHRGGDGGEDSHSSAALTAHSGSADDVDAPDEDDPQPTETMDRAKRKYYRKREQRMFGGGADSDDGSRSNSADGFVELKPEIVDFPRLHAREEELYFYDAFAYPWEKEKHYRMVYQLEKKYFPQYSLDKAFVDPIAAEQVDAAAADERSGKKKKRKGKSFKAEAEKGGGDGVDGDERALVFFDDKKETDAAREGRPTARGVSEKKVEEFFKCLRKVPKVGDERKATPVAETGAGNEPYLVSRRTELPPRWDGPSGTVVLVDKPKGWTSFTVCGKLRRLVKVQKVGHAGTLDPMATGLLVVCVGKATKVVDRYQGMVKGYSGIFRLGEATSTWDADSPVIQRESWEHIKDDDIRKAAASFLGEIWQVPPMFSAIKIGGEKMYDKARRGEMVELSPRRISIYEFDIERSLEDRQNLIFRVTCSKGTYIRSLCADLGKTLGSCAHLTALRRDSIGDFSADDAWSFQELEEQIIKGYF